jgi:hypothetical protein
MTGSWECMFQKYIPSPLYERSRIGHSFRNIVSSLSHTAYLVFGIKSTNETLQYSKEMYID